MPDKKLKFNFNKKEDNSHYTITPYEYSPKHGRKIIPTQFIDLGQGILKLIENIDNDLRMKK